MATREAVAEGMEEEEEGATAEADIKTFPALGPCSRVSCTYVMTCDLHSRSLLLDLFSCVALSCTVYYHALLRITRIMSRQYVRDCSPTDFCPFFLFF
jgi:hypothetical protein